MTEENINFDLNSIDITEDDLKIDNHEENKDSRITDFIDECVKCNIIYDKVKTSKEARKDIEIDWAKLLDIQDPELRMQCLALKDCNIKRRKVNGNKFFIFLNNFKVILSYMNHEELQKLFMMRILCEKWHMYKSLKQRDSILDDILYSFTDLCNRFIQYVDPIAYIPKCEPMENKAMHELYFLEDHLKYIIKVIVISKITLFFTDNIHKDFRTDAKKYISNKIWNMEFVPEDKNINIKNKIHKLISSRFVATEHNEKRFWNAAKFANITIVTQENILYNELKTDSILMLEFDRNPLSFLDVYMKNTIFYISKRKFPLEFILNNFDTQESNMKSDLTTEFNYDPLEYSIMKMTVKKFIETKVVPYKKLFKDGDDIIQKIEKNILHFWIVIPVISKTLNIDPIFLTTLNREEFANLIFYVHYKLIQLNCRNMAKLLAGKIVENSTGAYNENVKNASQIVAKFLKSDEFNNCLEELSCNKNITESIDMIMNPLITMTLNKYVSLYNEQLTVQTSDLLKEYLKFINFYKKL